MRALILFSVLVSFSAWADLVAENATGCQGQSAGAACKTDDGAPGVCTSSFVTRPDYSKGIPPGTKRVQMLLCVATGPAPSAKWSALLAIALLLAGLTVWVTRGRRDPAPA